MQLAFLCICMCMSYILLVMFFSAFAYIKKTLSVFYFCRVASAVGKGGDDLHTFLLKIGMQSSFPCKIS